MHWSGKVCIWLIVLGAIAASVMTAKMLVVRNSWTKKFEALSGAGTAETPGTYVENARAITKKKTQRNQLRNELTRANRGWERYWNNVTVESATSGPESLASRAIGTANGFEVGTVVHVFQPAADNSYTFVGPYRVADTSTESLLIMTPNWRPRASVPTQMSFGSNWRVRRMIPTANKSRFNDLVVELTLKDELLLAKQQNVKVQNQMVSVAKEHLQLRLRELNGEPDNQQFAGSLPPSMIAGLVQAIQDSEEQRNLLLTEVDDLRRKLYDTYRRFQTIRDNNKQLADRRPAPAALVTAGASQ